MCKLRVHELYVEFAENVDAINEETIETAVLQELQNNGYEVESFSTSTTEVKGLLIQDDTGHNIDEVALVQGASKTIKIALDTEGHTNSSSYVKIHDNYYEIIINGQDVNISREAYKQVNEDNSFEIKLTPPENGVTMTVAGDTIEGESPIVAGADIVVMAGENTGTFGFNVLEVKTSTSRDVNVVVSTNQKYATNLTIAADGGAAEIEIGGTLQLTATKTPSTSTDTVKWSIESGSGTVSSKGLVTANSDATAGSIIKVKAECEREDKTPTSVCKTFDITVKAKAVEGESVGDTVNNKSKIGYYADVDGNGSVDGVIYADLIESKSGTWNNNSDSTFSYTSKSGLKEYYIKRASYNDGHFGDHPIIAPKEGTRGNDRFYVMALNDFHNPNYYSWDYNDNGYNLDINYGTSENFGTGKNNTETLIYYWDNNYYAGSDENSITWHDEDIWANIQTKDNNNWFVPSKGEWAAFGANLGITLSNYYNTFGLSRYYWSSSQSADDGYGHAWYAYFLYGTMRSDGVSNYNCVRLSTTF